MTNDEYLKELASRGDGSLQAWFDAEHVDAQRDTNRTCPNGNETASNSVDSREKLEADIWSGCEHLTMVGMGEKLVNVPYSKLLEWLDRQAAITRKTEQAAWIQQANGLIHEANAERDELRGSLDTAKQLIEQYKADGVDNLRKIDELQAKLKIAQDVNERQDLEYIEQRKQIDELRDAINVLQKKQPYCYNPDKPLDTLKTIGRYIDELQAKVDELRELNEYHSFQYDLAYEDAERLQAQVDNLTDELAKRDKGIARLKRQRDEARQELEKNRWEYCETCEHAEHVDRLEAECDKLKRKEKQLSNELGLRDKAIEMLLDVKQELIAERDNLAADLRDCEQQRERLRQALGEAIDHAHEIMALVDIGGELMKEVRDD